MTAHRASASPPPAATNAAFDWARSAQIGPELARTIRAEVRRRAHRRLGMLGAAVGLALVTTILWRAGGDRARAGVFLAAEDPSAAVIAPERRTLPDGSTVELRAGAELRADYHAAQRRVILVRGEAHFDVVPQLSRPFVVVANGVQVRAVGTAFSVGVAERSVEVLVTEGVVALDRPAPASPTSAAPREPQRMTVGQRAVVEISTDAAAVPETLSGQELVRRLAWRVPRLQFSGTPLSEVVRLFRQHGGVALKLDDASLGGVRVSGILRANNTDALLRLLAADHDIVAEQVGGEVVLRRTRAPRP